MMWIQIQEYRLAVGVSMEEFVVCWIRVVFFSDMYL